MLARYGKQGLIGSCGERKHCLLAHTYLELSVLQVELGKGKVVEVRGEGISLAQMLQTLLILTKF